MEQGVHSRSADRRSAVVFDCDQYRSNKEHPKPSKQQGMGKPRCLALPPNATLK
jgi:hypothetical protein